MSVCRIIRKLIGKGNIMHVYVVLRRIWTTWSYILFRILTCGSGVGEETLWANTHAESKEDSLAKILITRQCATYMIINLKGIPVHTRTQLRLLQGTKTHRYLPSNPIISFIIIAMYRSMHLEKSSSRRLQSIFPTRALPSVWVSNIFLLLLLSLWSCWWFKLNGECSRKGLNYFGITIWLEIHIYPTRTSSWLLLFWTAAGWLDGWVSTEYYFLSDVLGLVDGHSMMIPLEILLYNVLSHSYSCYFPDHYQPLTVLPSAVY